MSELVLQILKNGNAKRGLYLVIKWVQCMVGVEGQILMTGKN